MNFDAIGVNFSEQKIMNIKRSLILLAILVVIFVGAVIAFYPNWLWFKNLDFSSVFWTMIVGRFGLVAAVWFFIIVILAVNLYIAQRLNPAGRQRPTAEIGGFPISGATLDNLILAAILIVSFFIRRHARTPLPYAGHFVTDCPRCKISYRQDEAELNAISIALPPSDANDVSMNSTAPQSPQCSPSAGSSHKRLCRAVWGFVGDVGANQLCI